MPKLIKNGAVTDDNWVMLGKDEALPTQRIDAGEQLILPLALWLAHQGELAGKVNVAVWLDSDEEPAKLCEPGVDCNALPLIAINFPVFADGRGYSYARQLREHYGYSGELRAVGDVLRDQLYFYQRCGFNSYALRADCDAEAALASLQDFTQSYQAANDNRVPVFRQR